jgi:hypothetical protein
MPSICCLPANACMIIFYPYGGSHLLGRSRTETCPIIPPSLILVQLHPAHKRENTSTLHCRSPLAIITPGAPLSPCRHFSERSSRRRFQARLLQAREHKVLAGCSDTGTFHCPIHFAPGALTLCGICCDMARHNAFATRRKGSPFARCSRVYEYVYTRMVCPWARIFTSLS